MHRHMGIKHRGEIDFGTIDTSLLLQLKRLDVKLEMDIKSKYISIVDVNEFVDTKETFILMPADPSVLASIAGNDAAGDDADWGGRLAGDAGCDTDDDDDEKRPRDEEASRAQAELLQSLQLPANVRQIVPKYPTLDEVELFESLLSSHKKPNGAIEWDAIFSGWTAAHADSLRLGTKSRKRVGVAAHAATLKALHEHVKKRAHLLELLEPLGDDLAKLDRVCFSLFFARLLVLLVRRRCKLEMSL